MKQATLFPDGDEARAEVRRPVEGVVLLGCFFRCPMCGRDVPVQLRVMQDNVVRNQPRCGPCRQR